VPLERLHDARIRLHRDERVAEVAGELGGPWPRGGDGDRRRCRREAVEAGVLDRHPPPAVAHAVQQADHDPATVDHNTVIPAAAGEPLADLADGVPPAAGGDVGQSEVTDVRGAAAPFLTRPAGREPVGLAGDVAVDLPVAEVLEPARGPCAEAHWWSKQ
jgi:hypothetical protein